MLICSTYCSFRALNGANIHFSRSIGQDIGSRTVLPDIIFGSRTNVREKSPFSPFRNYSSVSSFLFLCLQIRYTIPVPIMDIPTTMKPVVSVTTPSRTKLP